MKKIFFASVAWVLPAMVLADSGGGAGNVGGSGGGAGNVGSGSGGNITLINPLASSDITSLLNSIINFLLALAIPVATVMAIYAGYLLITARDNEEKVKQARQTLLWVVIGVMVLILSKSIVSLAQSFLTT